MVQLSVEQARSAILGHEAELSVAVSNSRRSTVLSGSSSAMAQVLGELEARGVFCKRVKVDYASHSPQVDSLREELIGALRGSFRGCPRCSMRSTVTTARGRGRTARRDILGGQSSAAGAFCGSGGGAAWRRPRGVRRDERASVAAARARRASGRYEGQWSGRGIFATRHPRTRIAAGVAWASCTWWVVGSSGRECLSGGRRVELPTYPWQRQRYWMESSPSRAGSAKRRVIRCWECECRRPAQTACTKRWLSRSTHGWLYEHRVGGQARVPGAGLAELLRAAAEHRYEGEARRWRRW